MNIDIEMGPSDSEIFDLQFNDRVIVSVVKICELIMMACFLRCWSSGLTYFWRDASVLHKRDRTADQSLEPYLQHQGAIQTVFFPQIRHLCKSVADCVSLLMFTYDDNVSLFLWDY